MSASVHFDLDYSNNHSNSDESSSAHLTTQKKSNRAMLKRSFSLVPERLESTKSSNLVGFHDRILKLCEVVLQVLSIFLVVVFLPFSLIVSLKVVAQYQRAVVFRLGRLITRGTLGPGLVFVLPCLDIMKRIDLRTLTFDVPTQEVLTRDSVTVAVDAVVYYRIFDPVMSVVNVEDSNRSTRLLAQTTLRNVLGTVDLTALLTDREEIAASMQETLDAATDAWGMKVERVEIKDVRLPLQLQRAMAAEAEAAREAGAKVIAAEGEHRASRALRLAAEELSLCPVALQLRYLQTLNSISAEKNSTIIFPLPVDVLSAFRPTSPDSPSRQHHHKSSSSSSRYHPYNHHHQHHHSQNYPKHFSSSGNQSPCSSSNTNPIYHHQQKPTVRVQMPQSQTTKIQQQQQNNKWALQDPELGLVLPPVATTTPPIDTDGDLVTSPTLSSSLSNGGLHVTSSAMQQQQQQSRHNLDYNSSECTV